MSNSRKNNRRSFRTRLAVQNLERRNLLAADAFDLHNDSMPLDVTGDGAVSPIDVLAVVNVIRRATSLPVSDGLVAEGESSGLVDAARGMMADVNNDGAVTPLDSLRVVNGLRAEGETDVTFALEDFVVEQVPTMPGQSIIQVQYRITSSMPVTENTFVSLELALLNEQNEEVTSSSQENAIRSGESQTVPTDQQLSLVGVADGEYRVQATLSMDGEDIGSTVFNGSTFVRDGLLVAEGEFNAVNPVVRNFEFDAGRHAEVKIDGDNLRIILNVNDNGVATITSNLDGVSGSETLTVPKKATIKIYGSNNRLRIQNAVVDDDFKIYFKGTGNGVSLENVTIGDDLIVDGHNGNDDLLLTNTRVADRMSFNADDGNDRIGLIDSAIGDDFVFHGDDGPDYLSASGTTIGDDAIIRMGDGHDIGAISSAAVNDVADIHGGNEWDLIYPNADLTARKLKLRGFDGTLDVDTLNAITNVLINRFSYTT